jgi:hypothetical protein
MLRIFSKKRFNTLDFEMDNNSFNVIGDVSLSTEEQLVLSHGSKFTYLLPPKRNIFHNDLLRLSRTIRIKEYFKKSFDTQNRIAPNMLKYHAKNELFQPPPPTEHVANIIETTTNSLMRAFDEVTQKDISFRQDNVFIHDIKTGINSIKSRNDLIIKPADKNLGLTAMPTNWYEIQCMLHLSDTSTYTPVSNPDITIKHLALQYKELIKSLKFPKVLSQFLLKNTTLGTYTVPPFYIIPKIHKNPMSSRPISASHSFITTPLAIWLNDQLVPFADKLVTVCKSNYQLINELEQVPITPNMLITTGDVTSLYPNIETDYALKIIQPYVQAFFAERTSMIMSILSFILKHHYTEFDGKIYHQIKGTAMGIQPAPSYANIFMFALEITLLQTPKITNNSIVFYKRYIDDILILSHGDPVTFKDALNAQNESIKITWNTGSADHFLDLDLKISPTSSTIRYKPYVKDMNKFLYIPNRSAHPTYTKRGMIRTELLRLARISDNEANFIVARNRFYENLRARGYPSRFLIPCFVSTKYHERNNYNSEKKNTANNNNATPLVFVTDYNAATIKLRLHERLSLALSSLNQDSSQQPNIIIARRFPPSTGKKIIRAKFTSSPGQIENSPLHISSSTLTTS